jgi:hypothetical protein
VISDGVSLSDKLGREMRAFVSEQAAFDAFLLRDGIVDVVSPNKDGVPFVGPEHNGFTGANKLPLL